MLSATYEFRVKPADLSAILGPIETRDITKRPPPPPPHKITFLEAGGIPVAIYETEHGKQIVGHLIVDAEIIRFTALSGTPGDELFFYALKIDEEGNLVGETYREGMPHSEVTGKKLSDI